MQTQLKAGEGTRTLGKTLWHPVLHSKHQVTTGYRQQSLKPVMHADEMQTQLNFLATRTQPPVPAYQAYIHTQAQILLSPFVLYTADGIQDYETQKATGENKQTKTLSRDEAINRTRLRGGQDIGVIIPLY